MRDKDEYRDLSELEKFLYMYINVISIPKDEEDKNTSHDIIGTILTQKSNVSRLFNYNEIYM